MPAFHGRGDERGPMLITMRKYLYPENGGTAQESAGEPFAGILPECVLVSLEKLFALEGDAAQDAAPALPGMDAAQVSGHVDGFAERQRGRMEEMRQLLAMLASLTDSVSRSGADSRRRLEEVERNLRSACTDSDIGSIRSRLERCLQSVREESAAREKQRREQLGILDVGTASLRAIGSGGKRGASRDEAIREIDKRVSSVDGVCVVFAFDQLASVSERFGVRASEAVVESYLRDIRMGLATQDEISQCAWGPRAMLLILPGSINPGVLRAAVEAVPLQRTVPAGTRFATISLNVRWACFDRSGGASSDSIPEKVDEFVNR